MDDSDADALTQLGSVFVRTEQPALARRAFRQCLELEGGAKWRWEIQQSLACLEAGAQGYILTSSSPDQFVRALLLVLLLRLLLLSLLLLSFPLLLLPPCALCLCLAPLPSALHP